MPKIVLIILILLAIPKYSIAQTIKELRSNKKEIISTLKKQRNKEELEKVLSTFDAKSLKEILRSFNLLKKKQTTKNDFIQSIIDNLPIIIQKEKEIDLPFFERKEYQKETYSKNIPPLNKARGFVIYKAAKLLFIDKEDTKGFRHLILFGKVELQFGNSKIEADLVKVKVDKDEQPIEAFALGNILIKQQNNRIIGKKVYFFPKTSRSLMIAPVAYFSPFYFIAEEAKRFEKEKYKFNNGIMTNDNVDNLHYKLTFDDAWYYNDEFVWANNVTYVVGDSTVFWSPFIFRSNMVTGILNSVGYDRDIGWYTNNSLYFIPGESIIDTRKRGTSSISGKDLGFLFKFDYYQKLGVYFGSEISYRIGKLSLNIDTGIAYDRSLDYIDGRFTNSFDHINNDGIPEETNNFRWTFDIDGEYTLFSSADISTSLSADFTTQSDPYFKKQFNSIRDTRFDLLNLFPLFDDQEENSLLSGGGGEDQSIGFAVNTNIHGLNLSLRGDFNYNLQLDLTDPSKAPLNEFDTDSYKQYKRSFIFPNLSLSYSKSFPLIGKQYNEPAEEDDEEVDYIESLSDQNEEDTEETKEEEIMETEEDTEKDILEELKKEEDLSVSLPLNISLSSSIIETQTYETGTENILDSDVFSYNSNVSLSLPFSISYNFIKFSVSSSTNVRYTARQTKNASQIQLENDEELTYPSWNTSVRNSLDFSFLKEYKYLALNFGSSVTYSKADRFEDPVKEGSVYKGLGGRSERISYNSYLNFLKTRLSVSFGDNLYVSPYDMELINQGIKTKTEILKEQHGNLSFSASSNPFDFISMSNSLNYSRKNEELIGNSLNINLSFNDVKMSAFSWIKSVNLSTSWYNDFKNPISSNLSINFQLNIYITKHLQIIYNVSASNNELYRYDDEYASKYGKEKRDFFQDLIDSFNFSNIKARQRALFKLNYLNFVINHDLHEWNLQFKLDFKFKEFRTGIYYFEPSVYLLIYLKELPAIKYPTIEKVFTRQ